MSPKPGEVWLADLGLAAKTRPIVVVSRYDPEPPRALVVYVPLTTQYRNSPYEVVLPALLPDGVCNPVRNVSLPDGVCNPVRNVFRADLKRYSETPYIGTLLRPQAAILKAFQGNVQTEGPYTDQWGTFISTRIPIKDANGQVIAILGLDYDVVSEVNQLNRLWNICMMILAVSVLLSMLLAYVLISYQFFRQKFWRWVMPKLLFPTKVLAVGNAKTFVGNGKSVISYQ